MKIKLYNPLILFALLACMNSCFLVDAKYDLNKDEEYAFGLLFRYLRKRIELARDQALHCWRSGLEPYEMSFDRDQISRAEKVAKKNNISVDEAVHITTNLLQAGKMYISVLLYNWYADDYFEDEYHPYGKERDIVKSRMKIDKYQDRIIKLLPELEAFQLRESCSETVAVEIFRQKFSKNTLSRVALQRAMGGFCKILFEHS